MTDTPSIAARIRAMVKFIGPGDMTPMAARQWNQLADEIDIRSATDHSVLVELFEVVRSIVDDGQSCACDANGPCALRSHTVLAAARTALAELQKAGLALPKSPAIGTDCATLVQ